MALTLSVPCADWLTPWLKEVTTRGRGDPQIDEGRDDRRRGRAALRGRSQRVGALRARRQGFFKALGVRGDEGGVESAAVGEVTSRPQNSTPSMPGAIVR